MKASELKKGYQLSITDMGEYVKVELSGKMTIEENYKVWEEILQACKLFKCTKIFGVSNLQRFETMQAYEHKNIFQRAGVNTKYRIAWVEKSRENEPMAQFVETVLLNRGLLNGQLFKTEEEALVWLLEQPEKI